MEAYAMILSRRRIRIMVDEGVGRRGGKVSWPARRGC
jgi:hypothetical protein